METLKEWLEALKASNKQMIVEGKNDKKALVDIGIKKEKITELDRPLFEVIELVAKDHKEVILLTDKDVEGKKLYSELKKGFQDLGVKIDHEFREFLFNETPLSHIEGISTYFKTQGL